MSLPLTAASSAKAKIPGISWPWDAPDNPILAFCFRILCWLSVGDDNLELVWEVVHDSEEKFAKYRKLKLGLISVITVVAGLLIATTAVFLTTSPPTTNLSTANPPITITSLLPYNTYGAYAFMTASFGAALGALIVGSTQVYLLSTCSGYRFGRLLGRSSRFRLWYALALMAYPTVAVGFSVILCATSLVLAGWDGDHLLYKIGTLALLFIPTVSQFFFILNVFLSDKS